MRTDIYKFLLAPKQKREKWNGYGEFAREREGEKGDKEREGIGEGISWIHLSFPVITQKEKKSVATKKQEKNHSK